MNGYECSMCDCDPCVCSKREHNKNIQDGKIAIESMWQALAHLPRWKRKIIMWLWPDIIEVAKDLKEYYWCDRDN